MRVLINELKENLKRIKKKKKICLIEVVVVDDDGT